MAGASTGNGARRPEDGSGVGGAGSAAGAGAGSAAGAGTGSAAGAGTGSAAGAGTGSAAGAGTGSAAGAGTGSAAGAGTGSAAGAGTGSAAGAGAGSAAGAGAGSAAGAGAGSVASGDGALGTSDEVSGTLIGSWAMLSVGVVSRRKSTPRRAQRMARPMPIGDLPLSSNLPPLAPLCALSVPELCPKPVHVRYPEVAWLPLLVTRYFPAICVLFRGTRPRMGGFARRSQVDVEGYGARARADPQFGVMSPFRVCCPTLKGTGAVSECGPRNGEISPEPGPTLRTRGPVRRGARCGDAWGPEARSYPEE
jgi:hypothetical protein